MEMYILKASAILTLFLTVYLIFLKNETFFKLNRFFLLMGLLAALLLPFVTFKEEIHVMASALSTAPVPGDISASDSAIFNWKDTLLWAYIPGILFFTGLVFKQLFGLFSIIRKEKKHSYEGYILIPASYIKGPFSFFRYIFYNPEVHEATELRLILEHEKAHGRQWHSLDILLARATAIVLWINPLVWWYQKIIQQNLEYLADAQAVSKLTSIRDYQYALLKVSGNPSTPSLVSHFNQSLIKKRIVMLQRNQSKSVHVLKYLLILPLLAFFLMAFNRETVYVVDGPNSVMFEAAADKTIELIIDKNTKDAQLLKIKEELAKDKIDFSYTTVRNDAGEIIDISLNVIGTSRNGNSFSASYNSDSQKPIKPTMLRITDEGGISIGEISSLYEMNKVSEMHFGPDSTTHSVWVQKSGDTDQEVIEIRKGNGKEIIIINGEEINIEELHEDGAHKNVFVKIIGSDEDIDEEDEIYSIELYQGDEDENTMVWHSKDGNETKYRKVVIDTEESGDFDSEIKFISTNGKKPLIFIDGKKASEKAMKDLSPDQIQTMDVFKGEKAIEKYGKKARDGVIEITTHKG
jgi:beta-lactamase regulating signal transducer with metallopeptidase domain